MFTASLALRYLACVAATSPASALFRGSSTRSVVHVELDHAGTSNSSSAASSEPGVSQAPLRVLITGFGPFLTVDPNPTTVIANILTGSERVAPPKPEAVDDSNPNRDDAALDFADLPDRTVEEGHYEPGTTEKEYVQVPIHYLSPTQAERMDPSTIEMNQGGLDRIVEVVDSYIHKPGEISLDAVVHLAHVPGHRGGVFSADEEYDESQLKPAERDGRVRKVTADSGHGGTSHSAPEGMVMTSESPPDAHDDEQEEARTDPSAPGFAVSLKWARHLYERILKQITESAGGKGLRSNRDLKGTGRSKLLLLPVTLILVKDDSQDQVNFVKSMTKNLLENAYGGPSRKEE